VWRQVRAYWVAQRQPCARCGRDIDYETVPRYALSLDVGHIVERDRARAMGWTDSEINALSNTQPEHQRCSRTAGVRYGNGKRMITTQLPRRPIEADEW
jgi:5-methylcytosine-specific restriction endonuclease McrA